MLWGYCYPYQWWLKYGHPEDADSNITNNYLPKETAVALPEPFMGSSLKEPSSTGVTATKNKTNEAGASNTDLANPILDELKVCFGDGPLASVTTGGGDLNNLVMALQNQLGPVDEDVLLEKKVTLRLKDGQTRTLVYEWLSPEEGSDVYWHETDEEGFPRPVDLPDGSGHDLATFERLKQQGTSGKTSETHLIELQSGMQLSVEKADDAILTLSLKDEGHLVKCRRDPVKSFVCDCLN